MAPRLLPTLAVFAVVSVAAAFLIARLGPAAEELESRGARSPFELGSVLKFALVLGLVMAAARAVSGFFGSQDLPLIGAAAAAPYYYGPGYYDAPGYYPAPPPAAGGPARQCWVETDSRGYGYWQPC